MDCGIPQISVRTGSGLIRWGRHFLYAEHLGLIDVGHDSVQVLIPAPGNGAKVKDIGGLFAFPDSVIILPFGFDGEFVAFDLKTAQCKIEQVAAGLRIRFVTQIDSFRLATTYGNGIYIDRSGTWEKLPLKNFPELSATHAIIPVDDFFLLTSNSGLFLLKATNFKAFLRGEVPTFQMFSLGESEGLMQTEFNGGFSEPIIKLKDGPWAMPQPNGLCFLRSDFKEFLPARYSKIWLEGIQYNDRDSALDLQRNLSPDFNRVKLNLLNPYYGASGNAKIYYRVPQLSEEWRLIDFEKGLVFDRLPSNQSYVIELYLPFAEEPDQQFQELATLRVGPRFHETLGFLLLIGFSSSFFVISILYAVQRRNRIQKEKLNQIIKDRTSELALNNVDLLRAVEDLESSRIKLRQALKVRDRMITVFSHDIRGPLRFVTDIALDLKNRVAAKTGGEFEKELEILGVSTKGAYDTANNVLSWIRSQELESEQQAQSLSRAVEKVLDQKAALFMKYGIRLIWQQQGDYQVVARPKSLEIVLENLLENAIKFCDRQIEIGFRTNEKDPKNVELYILDDGPGISDLSVLKAINNGDSVKSSRGRREGKGNGVGLIMVREIISQLGGRIYFENRQPGLAAILILPILKD